jgi:hypothetical protein
MTRAAKVTYIAAALVGLFLGMSLGFQKVAVTFDLDNDIQRSMASTELTDFSSMQYRHANPEHAEEALLMSVKFLEKFERLKPGRVQELRLGVLYLRLAVLEDAAHNLEQSRVHMEKAKGWYKTGGGHDYSDDEMKAMLKRFDERGIR